MQSEQKNLGKKSIMRLSVMPSWSKLLIISVFLLVTSLTFAFFVPLQIGSEKFSEFWLLGSDQVAEDFPSNVQVGEEYKVIVGVSNHMGGSEHYMIKVMLRNITQILSDMKGSVQCSLPSLYEYSFFVSDDEILQFPVSFGFEDEVVEGDVLVLGDVVFDGVRFPVDFSIIRDVNSDEFVFQLFFELWRYDMVSETFRFDDLAVGIWLNMTVP